MFQVAGFAAQEFIAESLWPSKVQCFFTVQGFHNFFFTVQVFTGFFQTLNFEKKPLTVKKPCETVKKPCTLMGHKLSAYKSSEFKVTHPAWWHAGH